MKNPLIALLLLLSLEAISRKSSASPTPRYAQNKVAPIPAIVGLTTSLTKSIDRIIEDSIDDSLDEVIREMEAKVSKIPWDEKDEYQKVMEGLINSQEYVKRTRSALERFAIKLKKRCRGLISMYNRNDPTMGLIKYSVKKFTDLSITVKMHLKKALIELKETSKELIKTKTYLMAFNNSRRVKQHEYFTNQTKEIAWYEAEKHKATIGSSVVLGLTVLLPWLAPLTITGGSLGFVAHPVYDKKVANIRRKIKELTIKDKDITSQVSSLINQTDDISNYVREEINLVNDWEDKLAESLRDHQEGITKEDLEYGIEEIKDRLTDLMEACENYLDHRFIDDSEIQGNFYEWVEVCINFQDSNSTEVPQFVDLSTLSNNIKENSINHLDHKFDALSIQNNKIEENGTKLSFDDFKEACIQVLNHKEKYTDKDNTQYFTSPN